LECSLLCSEMGSRAEPTELAFLLEARRIKSVPAVGLLLVYATDLEAVAKRPSGIPKGVLAESTTAGRHFEPTCTAYLDLIMKDAQTTKKYDEAT
jgi:hypothetical protein